MIPILFEPGTRTFENNGLGRLAEATRVVVTEERNGAYELVMDYPVTGKLFKNLVNGAVIYAKPSETETNQAFTIYSISKPMRGIVTLLAEHISYQLSYIPVMPFTATNLEEALQGLKSNAAEECPFSFSTDKTVEARYTQTVPSSIRARLAGEEGSILSTYRGEYEFDNFAVKLWNRRGADNGVTLRYGKNITDLTQEEEIRDTITGVCPFWRGYVGENEETVTLPERVLHSENFENFPEARTIALNLTTEFDERPTVEQLRGRAQQYMTENNIGTPKVSLSVYFVALWQTEEYKDIAPLEKVGLCDTVTVRFDRLGVNAKAEVIRTMYNVLTERYESIEIGEARSTLASTIYNQGQANQARIADEGNFFKNALSQAQELINGGLGGYIVTTTNEAGQPQEIVIMDSDDIATAVNCIRLNKNGIGFSQNGYNGPYNSAWTIDGTFDASLINVINLVASRVRSFNDERNLVTSIVAGSFSLAHDDEGDGAFEEKVAVGARPGNNGYIGVLQAIGTDTNGREIHADITPTSIVVGSVFNGTKAEITGVVASRALILGRNGTGYMMLDDETTETPVTWRTVKDINGNNIKVLGGPA